MEEQKVVRLSECSIKRIEEIMRKRAKDKKSHLDRVIEQKVEKSFKKEFPSFLKALNIKKELAKYKKAYEELEEFETSLEKRKRTLQANRDKAEVDLMTKFNRHSKINGWNARLSHDSSPDSHISSLDEICRNEIYNKIKKSTKEGQELEEMDARIDNFMLKLSYPALKVKEVDLNKSLQYDNDDFFKIILNPNQLKQLEA